MRWIESSSVYLSSLSRCCWHNTFSSIVFLRDVGEEGEVGLRTKRKKNSMDAYQLFTLETGSNFNQSRVSAYWFQTIDYIFHQNSMKIFWWKIFYFEKKKRLFHYFSTLAMPHKLCTKSTIPTNQASNILSLMFLCCCLIFYLWLLLFFFFK